MEEETGTVSFLELHRLGIGEIDMAFHSPDPAALRHDDGDRLALDHRFQGAFARRAGFLDSRAAAAKLGFRSVAVAKRRRVLRAAVSLGGGDPETLSTPG